MFWFGSCQTIESSSPPSTTARRIDILLNKGQRNEKRINDIIDVAHSLEMQFTKAFAVMETHIRANFYPEWHWQKQSQNQENNKMDINVRAIEFCVNFPACSILKRAGIWIITLKSYYFKLRRCFWIECVCSLAISSLFHPFFRFVG